MSENKFKVPAKSAPAKKEVSDAKAKDVKKTATKKSSSASSTKKSTTKKPPQSESVKKQVKSESPKKRVESSSTKAKKSSNLTFEKQELPKNNPNLGNYTLEERIAILNGSENKKKDEVKQEEKKEARVEITSLMESVKKNTPVAITEEETPLVVFLNTIYHEIEHVKQKDKLLTAFNVLYSFVKFFTSITFFIIMPLFYHFNWINMYNHQIYFTYFGYYFFF